MIRNNSQNDLRIEPKREATKPIVVPAFFRLAGGERSKGRSYPSPCTQGEVRWGFRDSRNSKLTPPNLPLNTGRGVRLGVLAVTFGALVSGCTKPDAANITLRKEKQDLVQQLAEMKSQRDANAATIRSLQSDRPTTQSLAQDRVEKLITTHDIRIGNLTAVRIASADPQSATKPSAPYILEVHAAPLDETGDSIKAAGSFSISAFDLSRKDDNLLGHWDFAVEQTRPLWLSGFVVYEYAMPCPMMALPAGKELTLRVAFTDALTGRVFDSQKPISADEARNGMTEPPKHQPITHLK